ncbi:MAG: transporter [Bacteroidales bacterium]
MLKFLFFVVLFILFSSLIFGQHFAAGNPVLSDAEQSYLSEKELVFSMSYQHTYSNKYYKEDYAINDARYINFNSNYAELRSAYAFTSKFSAFFNLGYFYNKTLNFDTVTYKGYGLGDVAIYFKYRLYNSKNAKFTLLPSIGILLPVGVFDQKDGTVNLPISVQPSSGNFKILGSVFMSKVMNDKLSISSLCSYEYAQLIDSRNFYYKYGDQWKLSFFTTYKFSERIKAAVQLRFENKDKSHLAIDKIVESSGYKIIMFSPQLSYRFADDWQISVFADLPVYRYYNGVQFAPSYSLSLKLLKKFDLNF